ncbi:MAG TPA: ATP-binding protein [Planctomycetota bacterium]|nr:ATP-binding protein [Planctomycetota bacterium]
MLERRLQAAVTSNLGRFPVVALLGPRQVGKTTLALAIADSAGKPSLYLDLERDSDRGKLADPEDYLTRHRGSLVVLDEIQRVPQLFPLLRSLVDERIRTREKAGHFLVLGSASRDLLRQSSESLAGRIAYHELAPFTMDEAVRGGRRADLERLWLRGGFPGSFLADDDAASWEWRGQFIDTWLERDVPQLGPRLPAAQVRRLWSMLALGQGDQLNAARLAAGLGVSANTLRSWLDVLTDLYMVRQLPAWSGNSRKRLVRSPKVYVRDSGLVHRLAQIPDTETLLGHPLCGLSWEGFAIEQLLARVSDSWQASYYRTSAQAEIDLVLEGPRRQVLAIEVKRTTAPVAGKGFLLGCEVVGATRRFLVMPAGEAHSVGHGAEAISLVELGQQLGEAAESRR